MGGEDERRKRFDDALGRDDPIELQERVQEIALHSEERLFAECACARLARHRNALVRGEALLGFAHLARRFGALDRNRVKRLIEIGLFSHHEALRQRAESAAEDLETLLEWRFERPRSA